jgi:hypothetical protein
MQEQTPSGMEAPIQAGGQVQRDEARSGLDDPRALQILSTEHWSLLATRSLAYNEIFTRAGMFLTFLAASLVALGLISAATGFTSQLALVAAVLLATDLFVGLATLGRLLDAGQEERECMVGMNRIRHAYRQMVPGIEPYFVTPFHDDPASVLSAYGVSRPGIVGNILHGVTTAPALVGVVDAVVAGALATVVLLGLGAPLEVGLVGGLIAFAAIFALGFWLGFTNAFRAQHRRIARFPAPPAEPPA